MHRQDVTEQALDWSSETPQVSAGTPFLIITTHFTQLILFFNHFLLKTVLELSPRPCEALGREYSWYQYVEARKLGHSGPFEGLTGQLGLHDRHWQIEQYHRAIKQVCHVEQFQVRTPAAIQNHGFAAICGYTQWQRLCLMDVLKNGYPVQQNLFNGVIAEFVRAFMPGKEHLKPQFHAVVNA
jgi:hypothetical protein